MGLGGQDESKPIMWGGHRTQLLLQHIGPVQDQVDVL